MSRDVNILVKVKDGFSTALKRAGNSFKSMASKVLTSAKTYKAAFAAVGVAAAAAVKEFAAFNKQMARVEALMGGSVAKHLRRDVLDLSSSLGIAKDELTNGLYNALSAGVPKGNVIEFLNVAAKAAIADASDISISVDGITTVLNAFKLEAGEAEKVADVMFSTVAKGKTDFAQLSTNIANVAPIAASMGVSFEEVFAAVATLTKQGTPTAQAMTQIRSALISTNDVLGDGWARTRSLQQGFAELSAKAGGSNNELKNLLGRIEAVNAVLGLTGKNAEEAAKDLLSMSDAAGVLDQAIGDSVHMSKLWDRLWKTIKVTSTNAGAAITSDLYKPIDLITKAIRQLNNFASETPKLFASIAKAPLLNTIIPGLGASDTLLQKLRADLNAGKDESATISDTATSGRSKIDAILDEIRTLEGRSEIARKARDKQAEIDRIYSLESKSIAEQKAAAEQEIHDDAVSKYIKSEEERLERSKQMAAKSKQDMIINAQGMADGMARALEGAADAQLFKNLTPAFSERFESFKDRRRAREEALKEDEKIDKRLERIANKEGRGIKISTSDAKFKADIKAFRDAEKKAKKLQAEAMNLRRKMVTLLEDNLKASGGPA